jgi:hypothetical protein
MSHSASPLWVSLMLSLSLIQKSRVWRVQILYHFISFIFYIILCHLYFISFIFYILYICTKSGQFSLADWKLLSCLFLTFIWECLEEGTRFCSDQWKRERREWKSDRRLIERRESLCWRSWSLCSSLSDY